MDKQQQQIAFISISNADTLSKYHVNFFMNCLSTYIKHVFVEIP